jgi:ubiquinone/menaquinone biosynthesis C-methylase UbiE
LTDLQKLQRNWEGFAQVDPLWAVLTDPEKEDRRWETSDFFATGKREIETVLRYLESLNINLHVAGSALDFGCGVGRLTQAMSEYFEECYGVDISEGMIEQARAFNKHPNRCNYVLNTSADLSKFADRYFQFIYSSIVLQHIPYKYTKEYLREFVRILKPKGILVFQISDRYEGALPETVESKSLRQRLMIRTRLKRLLRFTEISGYGRHSRAYQIKGFEFEMHSVEESLVRNILARCGATIIDVKATNSTKVDFNGNLEYLDKESPGYLSKQYCVTK